MLTDSISLILASQSPRRAQLLREAGFQFEVFPPADEAEAMAEKISPPEALVVKLAYCKALDVVRQFERLAYDNNVAPGCRQIVLAADTVAVCQGEVLGKPIDHADARRMLTTMSGREHQVLTGVCLWCLKSGRQLERLEITTLIMDPLAEEQLDLFLASGDWQGKAGGFGYQDGLDWLRITAGLASNVVGLPVERLPAWLAELDR